MIDTKVLVEQVNKVIAFSQHLDNVDCSALIEKWKEGKERFIMLFQDKLIYEYPEPITVELPQEDKDAEIEKLYDFIRFHVNLEEVEPLINFLESNREFLYLNKVSLFSIVYK